MPQPTISVVVPVYNSEATLPALAARVSRVLVEISSAHELVLVNDGSRDRSWSVIRRLAQQHRWVRGINLMRNYGQHSALLCGIRAAAYDVVVTIDDDLQHPPEEIPKLVGMLANDDCDVVYGTPQTEQHGVWRDLASHLTKLALRSVMDVSTARNVSAFRAFRQPVREAFADNRSPFISIDVLLTWGTTRFGALPVRHEPRRFGASNYSFLKLVTHALNMLTGFSTLPLRLSSLIGFTFTLFGLVVLAYVLGRYLIEGGSVPGFPFLASIIAIFSGAQLFALGIIGEYLARMHFRMLARPTYVVKATTDGQLADDANPVRTRYGTTA